MRRFFWSDLPLLIILIIVVFAILGFADAVIDMLTRVRR